MNDQPEQRQHRLAKKLSFRSLEGGDEDAVILYDVPLLTTGEWHDSLTPYPTVYTPENLSQFTVKGNLGYKSHDFTHDMDDEIGEAINIRYDPNMQAIMADLLFHQETQASRDVLAMIQRRHKQNRPAFVSIEMFTRDVPTERGMEAQGIEVTGWIATAEPACKRCAIPKQQAEHKDMTEEKDKQNKQETKTPEDEKKKEEGTADTADTNDQDSKKQQECNEGDQKKGASEGENKEDNTDDKEDVKKLSARIEALEKQVHALTESQQQAAELNSRIKALEQTASGRVTLTKTGSAAEPAIAPIAEYHSKPNY